MLIYEKVTGILKDYPRGHVMYCMQKSLCYGLLQIPVLRGEYITVDSEGNRIEMEAKFISDPAA